MQKPGHESQLSWRKLTLTLPNSKVLIENVDGVAVGGRCLSLMGPSGKRTRGLWCALPYGVA